MTFIIKKMTKNPVIMFVGKFPNQRDMIGVRLRLLRQKLPTTYKRVATRVFLLFILPTIALIQTDKSSWMDSSHYTVQLLTDHFIYAFEQSQLHSLIQAGPAMRLVPNIFLSQWTAINAYLFSKSQFEYPRLYF